MTGNTDFHKHYCLSMFISKTYLLSNVKGQQHIFLHFNENALQPTPNETQAVIFIMKYV